MKVTELTRTCVACPSQWEGRLDDGRWVYVRYRFGMLRVGVGATVDAAVDATMGFAGTKNPGESLVAERVGDEYDGTLRDRELVEHLARLAPQLDLSEVVG